MAKRPAQTQTTQEARRSAAGRTHVTLPERIASDANVSWPGSNRGGSSANVALREQLTADVQTMSMGSTRRYEITGKREQTALASLFRKVCDQVHGPIFGVQVATPEGENGPIFVRLGNRRTTK